MGQYDKVEITFWDEWGGVIFPLLILLPAFFGMCMDSKNAPLRENGVVIEKTVKPAWISSEDNYYLTIKRDDKHVIEERVAKIVYMDTNVGDRVKINKLK